MEALQQAIGQVAPGWQRPAGPTGGFIAAELKKIHDDSVSIFPESVYSAPGGRRENRWRSIMHSDYIPIALMKEDAVKRKAVKAQMGNSAADDCGVSGTLGGGNNSMFQSWKVPSRITESNGRSTQASLDQMAEQLEEIKLDGSRAGTALPQITGASPRCPSQVHMASPRSGTRSRQRHPKSLATKMLMDQYQSRDERGTAQRWLAQASDSELQMVEEALKVRQPVKAQAEVEPPVKDWLKQATPKEREVALTFFQSLAGTQLMGGSAEKKERVDKVIELLQNPPNKWAGSDPVPTGRDSAMTSSQRLRHLNVLTPATRKSKWRHQTWHHLPSYANRNKVINKSAILIEPHTTVPRHFTIHPDWGP